MLQLYTLRVHFFLINSICLGAMWSISASNLHVPIECCIITCLQSVLNVSDDFKQCLLADSQGEGSNIVE